MTGKVNLSHIIPNVSRKAPFYVEQLHDGFIESCSSLELMGAWARWLRPNHCGDGESLEIVLLLTS